MNRRERRGRRKRKTGRGEPLLLRLLVPVLRQDTLHVARRDVAVHLLVDDHHRRELSSRLLEKEHVHSGEIVTTLHVHLDHDNCLEAKIIRGRPGAVRLIADELMAMKGVKFGRLIPATAGKRLR
jgi:CopG family nickel-responsive transcriptional regulator